MRSFLVAPAVLGCFGRCIKERRATGAIVALVAQIGLGNAGWAEAQDLATQLPEFEVASIRPSHSNDLRPLVDMKPESFRATNVRVNRLIELAYGIKPFQIVGAPEWCGSDLFDINAKPPTPAKQDELNRMLQSLLASRFGLVVKRETRELPVYALTVGRSGSKLKRSDAAPGGEVSETAIPKPPVVRIRRGFMAAQQSDLAILVFQLSGFLGRPVLDKTGLVGKYDWTLEWTPDDNQLAQFQAMGLPDLPSLPASDPAGPSLFTALQEELGLRLESQKGALHVLVIEKISRPSAN